MLNTKELEEHELAGKTIYQQLPPKVEYHLTEFGKSLIPVISVLGKWGDERQEHLRSVIEKSLSIVQNEEVQV